MRPLLLLLIASGVCARALAAPVEVTLLPEALSDEGWTLGGRSIPPQAPVVVGDELVFSAGEPTAYSLSDEEASWSDAHPSRGWWVEAELAVGVADDACPRAEGAGFEVGDGWHGAALRVHPGELAVTFFDLVYWSATDTAGFHRYRLSFSEGALEVAVDDEPRFSVWRDGGGHVSLSRAEGVEVSVAPQPVIGWPTHRMSFGVSTDCTRSVVPFRAFRYEAVPPAPGEPPPPCSSCAPFVPGAAVVSAAVTGAAGAAEVDDDDDELGGCAQLHGEALWPLFAALLAFRVRSWRARAADGREPSETRSSA